MRSRTPPSGGVPTASRPRSRSRRPNVPYVPLASDPGFLVLHALRLKGFADTPVVGSATALGAEEAGRFLEKAEADGHASHRQGRVSGWALTPDGRARHAELVDQELRASGAEPAIRAAYRRFLAVNTELLTVCTDWQLRDENLNDHADADYDRSVVARLREVDTVIQPVCDELARVLDRFSTYGPRLSVALERVEAGERDWFAKPMIESYHTVWFELHEDLLATLGLERSKEGTAV